MPWLKAISRAESEAGLTPNSGARSEDGPREDVCVE